MKYNVKSTKSIHIVEFWNKDVTLWRIAFYVIEFLQRFPVAIRDLAQYEVLCGYNPVWIECRAFPRFSMWVKIGTC